MTPAGPAGRPRASLSLDLDNRWSYLKTHGDAGWERFPSFLDVVVPRMLATLARHRLTITVFVVGQDAALEHHRDLLAAIVAAGHGVGNHSFLHEPWLHLYTAAQIDAEIARADEHIVRATGAQPIGFRGPGFSVSHAVLCTLIRRGYLYDASTLPTFLGPLARAYYLMSSRLRTEQHAERKALFGTVRDGLRSIRPYRWVTDEGTLLEIPVTTMPGLRLPIHVTYLAYLAQFSPRLALGYLRTVLRLCRLSGAEPSVLLHSIDIVGGDDVSDLAFFPGMRLQGKAKLRLIDEILSAVTAHHTVLDLDAYARDVIRAAPLSSVDARRGRGRLQAGGIERLDRTPGAALGASQLPN